MVPSSARSTSSAATPLPSQLNPLLEDSLKAAVSVLEKAIPLGKKRTALEEAEFEDEGDEGALGREILMQSELSRDRFFFLSGKKMRKGELTGFFSCL